MNPYSGSLITPDHLLTNLAKHTYTQVLSFLSVPQRKNFEHFIIKSIRVNKLMTPFKIIGTAVLITKMTCTQVYATIPFAPFAYLRIMHEANQQGNSLPRKIHAGLHLLIILSLLVRTVWRTENRAHYIAHVQYYIETFLNKVRDLAPLLPSEQKYLSKPTLHRLYEFGFETLPLLGHAAVSQELNMEKMHQALKRSIEGSNNRNPHLFALRNSRIEDWKSRLSLLHLPLSAAVPTDLRSAYHLLSGRLLYSENQIVIPPQLIQRMNNILTGPNLPPSVLMPAPANVAPLSIETFARRLLQTAIRTSSRVRTTSNFYASLPPHAQNYLLGKRALDPNHLGGGDQYLPFLSLKFIPSWTAAFTTRPFRIVRDTVIETRVYSHQNVGVHYPHLLQTHRSMCTSRNTPNHKDIGTRLWYIRYILLPHLNSSTDDALLVMWPVTTHSNNIYPLPAPPLPAGLPPGQILQVPPPAWRRGFRIKKEVPTTTALVDNTIKRTGIFPVYADNEDVLISVSRNDGYPPQQG